ncbi:hypothetical protein D3C74_445480 [compost metagenome]
MPLKTRCVPFELPALFRLRLVLRALSAKDRALIIRSIPQPDMNIARASLCQQVTNLLFELHAAFLFGIQAYKR